MKTNDVLHAIVFADDTGFDKIVLAEGACALFAGRSKLIDEWKQWIASPNKVVLPRPGVEDNFAMCIIDAATGAQVMEHGQKITDDLYRFAGTGAKPAHTCWIKNKDALRAVNSAYEGDQYSGGTVKFLKVKSKEHNVSDLVEHKVITNAIITRGLVMYPAYEGKTVSIEDAAKTDPKVSVLIRDLTTGAVSAEAPSGLDPVVWTETDIKRLDDSLERFFGKIAK
ncbi:hypothetical protein E2K99_10530 [Herbaspirillum huttiense]|uniref:hypothetical protein n=1 Tax=Herbaspirillum huttiense TaxID=863372 RepID=UPI0010668AD3|nr:hypothetical protein [Herbaspirillum huttiense]QBP75419.1 hypothetical protein E2K99_10530 [Herbaspirillum huttiense]